MNDLKIFILRYTKYSDNFLIIKTLTDENSIESFMLHTPSKNKGYRALIFLASSLTITPQKSKVGKLRHIKEIINHNPFSVFDPYRTSLLCFMCEIFDKTLLENYSSEYLFSFFMELKKLISEHETKDLKFLPHYLIIKYLKLLGVYSDFENQLHSEVYANSSLKKILHTKVETLEDLDDFSSLHKRERKSLFYQLLRILEEQVDVRGKIISHEVFEKIF